MLTVLRNACRANKETVEIKRSKLLEVIMNILKNEGFIANYKTMDDKKQGLIKIYLKYNKDKSPAIMGIKRVSKSSMRVYKDWKTLPRVLGGIGIAVVTTSKGVMTADEARKLKTGGEVICLVW